MSLIPGNLPPVAMLHALEAAARHGDFTPAATELNVTQSAISHLETSGVLSCSHATRGRSP